jgi:opacity protein-like surface antigen
MAGKLQYLYAIVRTTAKRLAPAIIVCALGITATRCPGQTETTAQRKIMLSFFAGGTASLTGIQGVKNYGTTLGVDARLKQHFGVRPAIEVRGFLPFDSSALVSHKDVLAGIRVEKSFGRVLPYVDALFGRSSIRYTPYLPDPQGVYGYTKSSSNVYSPGAGLEYGLSQRFALKGDAQYQRYSTPVTVSGHAYATTVTVGVTYHLFGGEGPR